MVMEAWRKAVDNLEQCMEEYENAINLGDRARLAQCKKWMDEARAMEQDAYRDFKAEMDLHRRR